MSPPASPADARTPERLLAVGSYQSDKGLATWWWDGATSVRPAGRADVSTPSFACWHPTLPLLYAVSELRDGKVTTVSVGKDGSLRTVAETPTGGSEPCWVGIDPAGAALLIANYDAGGGDDSGGADSGDGTGRASMAVIGLDEAGIPLGSPVVSAHRGSGPVAERQAAAHVHQVVPTSSGTVLASDLGSDRLVEYRLDHVAGEGHGHLSVTEVGRVPMAAGSGPRHIALAADGATGFVTGELDGTVTVIRRRPGADGFGSWVSGEQAAVSGMTSEPGAALPSHLALAGGDRYLLVANRGPNTLAVLDVSNGLAIVAEEPVARGPRYFVVDGDAILLAGQHDDRIELLRLDATTGALIRRGPLQTDGASVRMPDVSCIALRPLGERRDGDGDDE